jgi:hypothetical protein
MRNRKSDWRWEEGVVDERKEHIELSYGNAAEMPYEKWKPIARIAKPRTHIFAVEWLVPQNTKQQGAMLEDVRQELDFYLVEKNEPDPWAYAIYHCNTGANMYSRVHWSYFPTGSQGERHASEVVQLPAEGHKKLVRDSGESSKYIIIKGNKISQDKLEVENKKEINKAVFIRHKMRTTTEILEDLWDKRQIAIHYEDKLSINPDDYEKAAAKNALKRLHKYCNMGVVVGAVYRKIRPVDMLVGIIPKGSKITPINRYGKDYIYKVVQLQNVKEISLRDYPLLAAIQPRLATIIGWPGAFDSLYSIVFDKPIPIRLENLSPGQLEVLCQEYLRMKNILKVLLLPIGRNLQDIDILGIGDDGNKVIAQVTHSSQQSKIDSKLHILKQYKGQGGKLIFFGPKSCNIADSDVDYISIETVFGELRSNKEAIYPKAIKMMFNR